MFVSKLVVSINWFHGSEKTPSLVPMSAPDELSLPTVFNIGEILCGEFLEEFWLYFVELLKFEVQDVHEFIGIVFRDNMGESDLTKMNH